VRVCKFNENLQCYGCFRSVTEVRSWNKLSDDEQRAIVAELNRRRDVYWNLPTVESKKRNTE
jgi:predicted Fe-S protein YdhL (DUF1289 family)